MKEEPGYKVLQLFSSNLEFIPDAKIRRGAVAELYLNATQDVQVPSLDSQIRNVIRRPVIK